MWLLDHNLPRQLVPVLQGFSINCDTTKNRGWENLRNGELVKTAKEAGFSVILTKDVDFGKSASKILGRNPDFSVIVLTLPQERGLRYAEMFKQQWEKNPITPVLGSVINWPPEGTPVRKL